MAEFKINIGEPKTGRSKKIEVKDDQARPFIGKRIGAVIKGEVLDMTGYEFKVTGGSDYAGFPMRKDVQGTARKKVLIVDGTGTKKGRKGMRRRRTVAGNQIYPQTAQINLKVTKLGKAPLFEEKKEEAPEEQKEAPKKEEPQPEKKEEKKQPEAKGEQKKETPADQKESSEKKEEPAKPKEEGAPENREAPAEEKKEASPEKKEGAPAEKA